MRGVSGGFVLLVVIVGICAFAALAFLSLEAYALSCACIIAVGICMALMQDNLGPFKRLVIPSLLCAIVLFGLVQIDLAFAVSAFIFAILMLGVFLTIRKVRPNITGSSDYRRGDASRDMSSGVASAE